MLGNDKKIGLSTYCKENSINYEDALQIFTSSEEHPRPMLLEVYTDKDTDTKLLREYYKSIKNK